MRHSQLRGHKKKDGALLDRPCVIMVYCILCYYPQVYYKNIGNKPNAMPTAPLSMYVLVASYSRRSSMEDLSQVKVKRYSRFVPFTSMGSNNFTVEPMGWRLSFASSLDLNALDPIRGLNTG